MVVGCKPLNAPVKGTVFCSQVDRKPGESGRLDVDDLVGADDNANARNNCFFVERNARYQQRDGVGGRFNAINIKFDHFIL